MPYRHLRAVAQRPLHNSLLLCRRSEGWRLATQTAICFFSLSLRIAKNTCVQPYGGGARALVEVISLNGPHRTSLRMIARAYARLSASNSRLLCVSMGATSRAPLHAARNLPWTG
jgi:hypothetical protein